MRKLIRYTACYWSVYFYIWTQYRNNILTVGSQRRVQNPVKLLQRSFCQKQLNGWNSLTIFSKSSILDTLIRFWIRLWLIYSVFSSHAGMYLPDKKLYLWVVCKLSAYLQRQKCPNTKFWLKSGKIRARINSIFWHFSGSDHRMCLFFCYIKYLHCNT